MRGNSWGHNRKSSLTPPLFFFSKQLSLTLVLEDLKDKSDCLHCLTFNSIKPGLLALKEGGLILLSSLPFLPSTGQTSQGADFAIQSQSYSCGVSHCVRLQKSSQDSV